MRRKGWCRLDLPPGTALVLALALLAAAPLFADGAAAPYAQSACGGRTTVAGPELESFYVGTLHLGFAAARISCFPPDSVLPQYVLDLLQKDLATARDGSLAVCPCVAMNPAEFDQVAAALPGRTSRDAGAMVAQLFQRYQQAIRNTRCSCLGGAGAPPPPPPTTMSCDQCAAQRCPACAGVTILLCEVMDGHPNSQACRECIRQNCGGGAGTGGGTPPSGPGGESQTLVVPNTQAVKVRTNFATVPGGIYRIQASGVINDWGNAPDGIDAVWCYAEWRCGREGQVWNQLRINGKGIPDLAGRPVPYNPGHLYSVDLLGDGNPIEFYCSDAQDSAGDNVGSFTVTVARVR